MKPRLGLIVAGPTASGKSALAMWLAEKLGGTVINADAMQCYRELRVLTARPSEADEASVPHRLYGTRSAATPGSAASWRVDASAALEEADRAGRLPILCGGTFLYLRALTEGLAAIPDPGAAARDEARRLLAELGAPGLHARLATVDGETAAMLRPSDGQRVARGWEVWRGTGRGLRAWQLSPALPPAERRFAALVLRPTRSLLRGTIERRMDRMLAGGALDEVAALVALGLDPTLPAMRAHGVPELSAYLAGTITLHEARLRTVTATVRYTRRQETWLRHHDIADAAMTLTNEMSAGSSAQQTESLEWVEGTFTNFLA